MSSIEQVRLGTSKDYLREVRPCGISYSRDSLDAVRKGIGIATTLCHDLSRHSGWWTEKDGTEIHAQSPMVFASKLALIHSELSEALEGARKSFQDDHLPYRQSAEVELADAVIRIFDLAGALGFDIGAAMLEKLAYNQQREDHKASVRFATGGKSI